MIALRIAFALLLCTAPVVLSADEDKATKAIISSLTKELKSKKVADRIRAAEALGELAEKGKPASRALCEALLDVNIKVRVAAASSLEKVNPTVHRLAVTILVDKDMVARENAVRALGELHEEGTPAAPIVLYFGGLPNAGHPLAPPTLASIAPGELKYAEAITGWLLKAASPLTRAAAATALPKTAYGKESVRSLTLALRTDMTDEVRLAAAKALGEIGSDAKEAIKALELAKTDSSSDVREAAAASLVKIQKN